MRYLFLRGTIATALVVFLCRPELMAQSQAQANKDPSPQATQSSQGSGQSQGPDTTRKGNTSTTLGPQRLPYPKSLTKKPIPYTNLREADVMWHKRIWRIIDLREKMNHPLYYPIDDKLHDRESLFRVIKEALLPPDGSPPKIAAYLPAPAGDDEFTIKMNQLEIQDKLMKKDTSYVPSDPTDPSSPMVATPTVDDVGSGKVVKYYVKEDWFFDKQRSVLEARIIGIQPITAKTNEKGEVVGDAGTFWIYFPELRPLLSRKEVFNKHNEAERLTFDDLFWKRMFSSYIQKESNVYDRFIREYKTETLDQLLESEKIKENVFLLEHDLWHL